MSRQQHSYKGGFPLFVFDEPKLHTFLHSCAFMRAAAEDLRIKSESSGVAGALGYAYKRVDGAHSPQELRQIANNYYFDYVKRFHSTLSEGPGGVAGFLNAMSQSRSRFKASIDMAQQWVEQQNKGTDGQLVAAMDTLNVVNALGTVVLATGATVAAVTGSAAAAPVALVYLLYKGGLVMAKGVTMESATAYAVGEVKPGGIGSGFVVDKLLEISLSAYTLYVLKTIRENHSLVQGLEQSILRDAGKVANMLSQKHGGAMLAKMAQIGDQCVQQRAKLEAARNVRLPSAGMTTVVTKVAPIVCCAADVLGAYSDWYDTDAQIHATDHWKAPRH